MECREVELLVVGEVVVVEVDISDASYSIVQILCKKEEDLQAEGGMKASLLLRFGDVNSGAAYSLIREVCNL